LSGQQINLYETLDGLQAEDAEGKSYLLRNYRKEICRPLWSVKEQGRCYHFARIYQSRRAEFPTVTVGGEEKTQEVEQWGSSAQSSPRIAVAYSQ
jgi:hypothetical protein